ncbi:MAG: DJ-1/PfpI family protein [Anaerolineae bacterium]|nr:DJ-1/PfpI family protein [Anaerolineae bacterium]
MSRNNLYIFVLWADGFLEAAATIFVTELRRAGIRVKVIGSSRQHSKGTYGLALTPDLTLSQANALLPQITHLIIPATFSTVRRLKNDPCVTAFFEQINRYNIPVFIGDDAAEISLFIEGTVTVFPADSETLVSFARQVARRIAGT